MRAYAFERFSSSPVSSPQSLTMQFQHCKHVLLQSFLFRHLAHGDDLHVAPAPVPSGVFYISRCNSRVEYPLSPTTIVGRIHQRSRNRKPRRRRHLPQQRSSTCLPTVHFLMSLLTVLQLGHRVRRTHKVYLHSIRFFCVESFGR